MKIKVYLMSSFGIDTSGGNPAGVVLDADNLSESQKKQSQKRLDFQRLRSSKNLIEQISK